MPESIVHARKLVWVSLLSSKVHTVLIYGLLRYLFRPRSHWEQSDYNHERFLRLSWISGQERQIRAAKWCSGKSKTSLAFPLQIILFSTFSTIFDGCHRKCTTWRYRRLWRGKNEAVPSHGKNGGGQKLKRAYPRETFVTAAVFGHIWKALENFSTSVNFFSRSYGNCGDLMAACRVRCDIAFMRLPRLPYQKRGWKTQCIAGSLHSTWILTFCYGNLRLNRQKWARPRVDCSWTLKFETRNSPLWQSFFVRFLLLHCPVRFFYFRILYCHDGLGQEDMLYYRYCLLLRKSVRVGFLRLAAQFPDISKDDSQDE